MQTLRHYPAPDLADTAADEATPPVHEPRLAALGPLVDLEHTNSAALVGDAGDPHPRRSDTLRRAYRSVFWWGVLCGVVSGAFGAGIVIGIATRLG